MELTKYEGDLDSLLDKLGFEKKGLTVVLKKPRGRKSMRYCWMTGQSKKDLWFISMNEVTDAKKPENYIITAKDFPRHLEYQMRVGGYEIYLDEVTNAS